MATAAPVMAHPVPASGGGGGKTALIVLGAVAVLCFVSGIATLIAAIILR
jgi:hypothetical protein